MKRLFLSFLSISLLIVTSSLYAWNALGHMVIANIAYDNLKPNVRKKVDDLILYFQKEYPDMNSFTQISYWPDSLRSQKIESFTHWHYINLAFSNDGTRIKNMIDTDNAVWAFANMQHVIKNDHANPYERVRFLAFLIHIASDLHQPLHTITYMSAAHPDGDKGGNLYYVRYNNQRIKLHSLWDQGVGVFAQNKTKDHAKELSKAIMALYPTSFFGEKINEVDANNWAKEGLKVAKEFIYSTPENQTLSFDYIDKGKQLAQQQSALAGYRLANLLNQLLAN